jgi:hypothetical protein
MSQSVKCARVSVDGMNAENVKELYVMVVTAGKHVTGVSSKEGSSAELASNFVETVGSGTARIVDVLVN